MNAQIKNMLIFTVGLAVGGLACWKFLDAKFEKRYEKEVEESKERFKAYLLKDIQPIIDNDNDRKKAEAEAVISAPVAVKKVNYNAKSGNKAYRYVIDPNDLGEYEKEGYSTVSYTHYSDNVLLDEMNDPVTDIDDFVGSDYKSHLGEYEDDSVCIRNDKYKMDIQIIFDSRRYADVSKTLPTRLKPED